MGRRGKLIGVLFCVFSLIGLCAYSQNTLPIKEKYDFFTDAESKVGFNRLPELDENNYGDGWSKILDGYLFMYETTGDKGYLYHFVQESMEMMSTRHDVYSSFNTFEEDYPRWTFYEQKNCYTPSENCPTKNYQDGYIIASFAKFSYLIKQNPVLFNTPLYGFNEITPGQNCTYCTNYTGITFPTFGQYANWLQNRVGETLYWFINNGYWDSYEGFSQTYDEGDSFKTLVINQQAGFAKALLFNGLSAGNQDFILKATNIALRMKGNVVFTSIFPNQQFNGPWLRVGTDNNYIWQQRGWRTNDINYQEYINANAEDLSHGAVDVLLFYEFNKYLPLNLITNADMVKFHNMFTRRLYDGAGEFYGSVDGSDFGYNPYPGHQNVNPEPIPHNLYKYNVLGYSILGDYDSGTGVLSSGVDGKNSYEITKDFYQNEIHTLNNLQELANMFVSPGRLFSYGHGAITLGHAMLVNQQWKRECTDLSLFKRKVVYNQDFWAQGLLTIEPQSLSSLNSIRSFTLPHITTQEFTIVPNVSSELRGGDGVTLKPGFSAKKGCNVVVVAEAAPCVKSAYLSTSTNSITETSQQYSIKEEMSLEELITVSKPSLECFIYPNPSTGLFKVSFSEEFLNGEYHVFDLLGSSIMTGKINKRLILIDLSDKENGVYTVQFNKGENVETRKVIKQ